MHTYILSAENRKENGKNLLESYIKKEFAGKSGLRKKKLAKLLVNKKAVGLLPDFVRSIEVGTRKGTKKQKLEWKYRND